MAEGTQEEMLATLVIDESMLRRPQAGNGEQKSSVVQSILMPLLMGAGVSAATIAALLFGKTFTQPMAARVLPAAMDSMDSLFRDIRSKLFTVGGLQGNVLDFGAGAAPYLSYAFQQPVGSITK